jgi:hypothetical protein
MVVAPVRFRVDANLGFMNDRAYRSERWCASGFTEELAVGRGLLTVFGLQLEFTFA